MIQISAASRALGAVLGLAFVALPSVAVAGEYHVYGCRTPEGLAINTDGWDITDSVPIALMEQTSPPIVGVTDRNWQGWVRSCAAGGGFGAVMNAESSATTGGPRHAVLAFRPGAGLVISRGVLYRALSSFDSGRAELAYSKPPSTLREYVGSPGVLDSTTGNASAGNAAVPLWPANRFDFPVSDGKGALSPSQPVTGLDLAVSCGPTPPCGGASAQVFRSDLVLSDPDGPAVDLVGGTVAEQGGSPTARVLGGNESVTIAANDSGVGVDRVRVEIDGQSFAEGQLRGVGGTTCKWSDRASDGLPSATAVRPCPPAGSGTVALDTTKLADGVHQLRVFAVDGSGSATTALNGRILVRNTSAVGPNSPDEFRGAFNGTAGEASLTAGWTATARPAKKNKATQKACKRPSYRRTHEVTCSGRPPQPKLIRDWSRTKAGEISGSVVDTNGRALVGAVVDVATVASDGVRTRLGVATTDQNGDFKSVVPLAQGSRTIAVSWRARLGDTVAAAERELKLQIQAGSTFSSSGVRVGSQAKFSGRVVAGDLTKGGASVRLQYLVRGRWTNFDTATTNEAGRWSVVRRLTQPTTYRMRVVVEDSPSGLFDGVAGPTKTVRVR